MIIMVKFDSNWPWSFSEEYFCEWKLKLTDGNDEHQQQTPGDEKTLLDPSVRWSNKRKRYTIHLMSGGISFY